MSANEYMRGVRELSALIDRAECSSPGEPDYERVNVLVDAVVAYERQHDPIAPPSSMAVELFRREQLGETVNWDGIAPRCEGSIR